jgi:predicted small lipoprotein YifL
MFMYRLVALSFVILLTACEKNQPIEIPPAQQHTREANG